MRKIAWLAASLIAVLVILSACAPGSAPQGQTWVLATVTPSGNVAPAAVAVAVAAPAANDPAATPVPATGASVALEAPAPGAPVAPQAPVFAPPMIGSLTNNPSAPKGMLLGDVIVNIGDQAKVANGGTRGTCALILTDGSVTMKAAALGATLTVFQPNMDFALKSHINSGGENQEGCMYIKIFEFANGELTNFHLAVADGTGGYTLENIGIENW